MVVIFIVVIVAFPVKCLKGPRRARSTGFVSSITTVIEYTNYK